MGPGVRRDDETWCTRRRDKLTPGQPSNRSRYLPPVPVRSTGSRQGDGARPDELTGFVAECRARSLPAIAAHHDAIVSGGKARDLKLVVALLAPEPRQAVIGPGIAGQPRRPAAGMTGGVV